MPPCNDRSAGGGILVLSLITAVGFVVLGKQWLTTAELRAHLELARAHADELGRFQVENRRLKENQISTTELERLRADRAALPRLRAEVEALKKAGDH